MGQAESHQGQHSPDGPSLPGGNQQTAFHVLRVAEGSPAAEAGLEPFFDFIVGAGGRQIGDEIDALTDVLENSEGRQVPLQVYSTKRKELRDVYVVPSRTWSSEGAPGGQVDGQPSLLGLSLRLCNPAHALEQVWHVLEILEGSPAQSAGLVPFGDWIVGYAGGVLRGEGDFYDVVESHVDKPLRLFVYNSDYDVTREAILVPNRSWGGEGLLGCGVGYGLLHRIPKPQDRSSVPNGTGVGAGAGAGYSAPPPAPYSAPAPPPPRTSTDRLTSFGPTSPVRPPAQNPLYIPPPPRTNPAAPPPPRRTAALASPPPSQPKTLPYSPTRGPPPCAQPQPTPPRQSHEHEAYTSHPSFAHYERPSAGGFGAYDATEGVEVVPAQEEEEDVYEQNAGAGGFVSAASLAGGAGMMQVPYGAGAGAGGYRAPSPYRAATVIAEEAE
ncbi:hypothetical protein JCM10207_005524 [Rhodosporidiobolus poonsookiae]